jgi:hypothetical protein
LVEAVLREVAAGALRLPLYRRHADTMNTGRSANRISGRLQAPTGVKSCRRVPRRDLADDAIQTDVVVMLDVAPHQAPSTTSKNSGQILDHL